MTTETLPSLPAAPLPEHETAAIRRKRWQRVGTNGGIIVGLGTLLFSPVVLLGAGCDYNTGPVDEAACQADFNRMLIWVLAIASVPLITALATLVRSPKMRRLLSPVYLLGACIFGIAGVITITTIVGPLLFGPIGFGLFSHISRKGDAGRSPAPPSLQTTSLQRA